MRACACPSRLHVQVQNVIPPFSFHLLCPLNLISFFTCSRLSVHPSFYRKTEQNNKARHSFFLAHTTKNLEK